MLVWKSYKINRFFNGIVLILKNTTERKQHKTENKEKKRKGKMIAKTNKWIKMKIKSLVSSLIIN